MSKLSKPSPALVLAFAALFVALGGAALAATAKKNSVATKSIRDLAVTTPKLAADAATGDKVLESSLGQVPSAASADNAAKLGGESPAKYQKFCEAGTVKGSIVIDTSTLAAGNAYHNAIGFNCAAPGNVTTSVQIRREGTTGTYFVKFPNAGTGSAVSSGGLPNGAPFGDGIIVDNKFQVDGGEPAFLVEVHRAGIPAAGTGLKDNELFSLLAF
ncbi:MAG: hypothetical protein QOG62_1521 [Thermoleophilaceae bacterium]|nr:hypothetical protein [Thermoleophilaceae bacterium]